ncbi:hypothetical protein DICVIV_01122 [Dictyocaulus viviparus]|uniref:Uncharacterized protein n=1 Tax=Dictyocaulus viviparus TaxID=29172 RepID=A0A0D8YDG8_DICVI|nr:hypothetical protein DICVIV_01122 [Dictyocaulus viviparus]
MAKNYSFYFRYRSFYLNISFTIHWNCIVSFRNFRHQIADSVRKLLRSPINSPTKLFFKKKNIIIPADRVRLVGESNQTTDFKQCRL